MLTPWWRVRDPIYEMWPTDRRGRPELVEKGRENGAGCRGEQLLRLYFGTLIQTHKSFNWGFVNRTRQGSITASRHSI